MSERYQPGERRSSPEQAPDLNWPALLEEALSAPGQMGNTYNRFRVYSFQNQILLMHQGVFEPVNTYNRWSAMGRQVKRGSRAKSILVPLLVRKAEDMDEQELRGFKLQRCLFGASDTDGEPLPPFEPLDWSPERALEKLNIAEERFDELNGNIQGISWGRSIAINPVAAYPAKTLMHEMAHVVAGHTTAEHKFDHQAHRGEREFVAESSAYLLMHETGGDGHMNAPESRAYIQEWLRGQEPSEKAIKQVFSVVDKILKAGRTRQDEI